MTDTSPEVERAFREMLLQRSGEERLRMGCSMHATAQALVRASVLEKDPLGHDIAFAYTQAAVQNIKFDNLDSIEFDNETAEAWLKIEKKKRKTLAKTKHPAKAVADEAEAAKQKNRGTKPEPSDENEVSQ